MGFWYELRMLAVTFLVTLLLWTVPAKAGGLRLIRTLKAHYEDEVRHHG